MSKKAFYTTAREIRELAEKSKMDIILKDIEHMAKKGDDCLNLFHSYGWPCTNYNRKYIYDTSELDKLRELGYKIENVEELKIIGWTLWLKKTKVHRIWHKVTW